MDVGTHFVLITNFLFLLLLLSFGYILCFVSHFRFLLLFLFALFFVLFVPQQLIYFVCCCFHLEKRPSNLLIMLLLHLLLLTSCLLSFDLFYLICFSLSTLFLNQFQSLDQPFWLFYLSFLRYKHEPNQSILQLQLIQSTGVNLNFSFLLFSFLLL